MTRLARQPGDDINLRSRAQMLEYAAIADRVAQDTRGPVLDWGCGFGQLIDLLERRGVSARGLEFDPDISKTTEVALERFPHLTAVLTDDPIALPYASESFDAVLSCGVLEHVEDPEASVDEIRRVLHAGGTFYVFKLPNRYSYLERVAKIAGGYYHGAWEHDRVYTERSACELLHRHGFEVLEVRRANVLPLTLPGTFGDRIGGALWGANRLLSRIPPLRAVATNIELTARKPR
ncbi:MAG: hypothetical protein QOG90_1009 [Actinomycetota bacterium]|jgi:SAM-dependent methyltransferase